MKLHAYFPLRATFSVHIAANIVRSEHKKPPHAASSADALVAGL